MTTATNFASARVLISFNMIQLIDQRFQNHSAKNLEMCKD